MVPKEQRHKLEVAAVWAQQQQVQIGLRLQELQRSAVEEVQPHLDDRPGSELTSDHSGGVEQPTVRWRFRRMRVMMRRVLSASSPLYLVIQPHYMRHGLAL
ncbi:hypothetical protein CLOM_g2391 [Closterium sp. NIES-68]|nr:hypothetical protein CLOM_g2391 [Closterium sp. NIES-68]